MATKKSAGICEDLTKIKFYMLENL